MAVDSHTFRDALARFPSGVCVVTTVDGAGQHTGFTASAFSALSLDPPLVLVCLDQHADSYPAFSVSDRFAVSILAANQAHLASHFATKGISKFDGLSLLPGSEVGALLIPDSIVQLECRMHQTIPAGDHTILIGEVLAAYLNPGEPLVHYDRQYGAFQPSETSNPT